MFEVKSNLVFWTSVSFGILVFVLYRFLLPPLLKLLDERRQLIQNSLRQAEENDKRSKELARLYKEKLLEAGLKAEEIISLTKKEARELHSQLLQDTKREASVILRHANQEIEHQKSKIMRELKDKTANLVIEATKKVIAQEIGTQDHLKLIEESLAEIEGQL